MAETRRDAIGHKAGHDQGRTAAKIGRLHLRAREAWNSMHDGVVSLDGDVGAHALQLTRKHESVLEDILGNHARALGECKKAHGLRLHVGGKSREGQRLNVWWKDGAPRQTVQPRTPR